MEKPTNAVQEVIDIGENEKSADLVDGRNNRSRNNSKAISNDNYYYHTKKSVAEGTNMGLDQRWPSHGQNCGPSNSIDLVPLQRMMDISLLTANANQLKFLLFYNQNSTTFWPAITLIVLSLVLQIIIGFTLIFRRRFKTHGQRRQVSSANEILILLMFLVTIINILAVVLIDCSE